MAGVKKTEARNRQSGASTKVPRKSPKKAQESEEKKYEKKTYEKYLRSDDFKEVKDIVHQRDKVCQFCGRTEEECEQFGTTLQVHHREYKYLGCGGEKEASTCILLCGCCHRAVHSAPRNLRRFTDKSPIFKNLEARKKLDVLQKVESKEDGRIGYILRAEGEGFKVLFPSDNEEVWLTEEDFTRKRK